MQNLLGNGMSSSGGQAIATWFGLGGARNRSRRTGSNVGTSSAAPTPTTPEGTATSTSNLTDGTSGSVPVSAGPLSSAAHPPPPLVSSAGPSADASLPLAVLSPLHAQAQRTLISILTEREGRPRPSLAVLGDLDVASSSDEGDRSDTEPGAERRGSLRAGLEIAARRLGGAEGEAAEGEGGGRRRLSSGGEGALVLVLHTSHFSYTGEILFHPCMNPKPKYKCAILPTRAAADSSARNTGDLLSTSYWVDTHLPLFLLLLIVFISYHVPGLSAFALLTVLAFKLDEVIRAETVRGEQRRVTVLLGAAILLSASIALTLVVFREDALWRLLLVVYRVEVPTLTSVFFLVVMSDLIVRLAIMAVKCLVVMGMAGAPASLRTRTHVLTSIEYLSAGDYGPRTVFEVIESVVLAQFSLFVCVFDVEQPQSLLLTKPKTLLHLEVLLTRSILKTIAPVALPPPTPAPQPTAPSRLLVYGTRGSVTPPACLF